MKLNIDALRAALAKPKTAIHRDTEGKAEALDEAMGQTYRVSNACDCYSTDGGIGFSAPRSYFESHGYTILTLDDFILPNKPRLAEVLGVEVGQEFAAKREDEASELWFRVDEHGHLHCCPPGMGWQNTHPHALVDMINNPHLIRIIPRWTEDDIADADAAMRLLPVMKWVARDKDGYAYLYRDKPERAPGASGFYGGGLFYRLEPAAFPSVRWDNSPVELRGIK